jgi:hypothetical protein
MNREDRASRDRAPSDAAPASWARSGHGAQSLAMADP